MTIRTAVARRPVAVERLEPRRLFSGTVAAPTVTLSIATPLIGALNSMGMDVTVRVAPATAGGPVPTGTVVLFRTAEGQVGDLGEGLLTDGSVTIEAPLSEPGIDVFSATYSGDGLNAAATSPPVVTALAEPTRAVPTIVADPFPATVPAGGAIDAPLRLRLAVPDPRFADDRRVVRLDEYLTNDPSYDPLTSDGAVASDKPQGSIGVFLGRRTVVLHGARAAATSVFIPSVPGDLPAGTYTLVVDAAGNNLTPAAASVVVTAVPVSLAVTIGPTGPLRLPLRGGSAPVRVTVTNTGPSAATGLVLLRVGVVSADYGTVPPLPTAYPAFSFPPAKLLRQVDLAPGASLRPDEGLRTEIPLRPRRRQRGPGRLHSHGLLDVDLPRGLIGRDVAAVRAHRHAIIRDGGRRPGPLDLTALATAWRRSSEPVNI